MFARMFALSVLVLGLVMAVPTGIGLLVSPFLVSSWQDALAGFICSGMILIPGTTLVVVGRKMLRHAEGDEDLPAPERRPAGPDPGLRPRVTIDDNNLYRLNALGWALGGIAWGVLLAYVAGLWWLEGAGRLPPRRPIQTALGLPGVLLMWLVFRGGRWALERFGLSIYRR